MSYCQEVGFGHESLQGLTDKTIKTISYSCLFLIIQTFTPVLDSAGALPKIRQHMTTNLQAMM